MDDVVTKDCIVVVVPRQSPAAMASQNTTSSSSSSSNTNLAGAANTAGTAQGQTQTQGSTSSKKPRSTAKPSSSTASKPAVKKKKAAVATASAPSNASQPSSSAAAAAKQLGLAASTCPRKRNHVQAFPPTQDQDRDDVAQLSRPVQEQPKKPEYPRRAAPADAINQPCFEVMSIHSEDEYGSDSDEPLIEGQKRRIKSKASSQSVSHQNTAQSDPQASAQVQSLAKVLQEKDAATKHAARLQKQVDEMMQKQLNDKAARHASMVAAIRNSRPQETVPKDAAAARISELERENRHVSEMNVNGKVRYGQLQARHSMLQNEYDQKMFDHKQLEASHKQLQADHKQLEARNKQWEVENKQLQDEVDRLRQKDMDWQAQWDERMAREKKWGEILGEVAINLYPHMHRGSGGAPL